MSDPKFDIEFEEDILAACMRDVSYLKHAARLLDAHHFNSEQHAWVWKCVKDIWDKYRESATGPLIIARARNDFQDDDAIKVHIQLVSKIGKRTPKAVNAKLEHLTTFVKRVNIQLAMESALEALEKNKVDEAHKAIAKCASYNVGKRVYTHEAWIENFKQRQADRKQRRDHPELYPRVPTGFKKLDHILSGGIEVQELGLVLGTTGMGKSITLCNMCFSAVRAGFPAVYFAMEMPARQIATRQDARWLKLPYRKFKEFEWLPSELKAMNLKLDKVHKRFENKLHILSMPVRAGSIMDIRNALDDLWTDYGFKAKVIFVDSGDHLNAVNIGRHESFRLQQSSVYWDLAHLADEEGYAIWSSTHAGREWSKDIAEAEAAGESYDKARIADIVMSINKPEKKKRTTNITTDKDDDEDDDVSANEAAPSGANTAVQGEQMVLRLSKYRDGQGRVSIPIDAQFAMMYMEELDSEAAENAGK
jgi:replicative DNA helicase